MAAQTIQSEFCQWDPATASRRVRLCRSSERSFSMFPVWLVQCSGSLVAASVVVVVLYHLFDVYKCDSVSNVCNHC